MTEPFVLASYIATYAVIIGYGAMLWTRMKRRSRER